MGVRQQDIAKHLGVSVSTVSLAFQKESLIAHETRSQVLDVAKKLGYTHHPRKGTQADIAQLTFVMPYEAGNVFYGAVMRGAESECRRQDIALHYTQLEELTPRLVKQFKSSDALILVGSIDAGVITSIQEIGLPLVLVDNNLPNIGIDRVLIENTWSIFRVVKQLKEWGHTNIAFMPGTDQHPSFEERLLGYRIAVTKLSLNPIELPVPSMRHRISGTNEVIEASRENISDWLALSPQKFSAIVLCNDLFAIGAIQALQEYGLRVPEDVSVVGFDDNDLAQVVRPTLTTCHVNREFMGHQAVRLLMERLDSPRAPNQAWLIDTNLVARASTAPHPNP